MTAQLTSSDSIEVIHWNETQLKLKTETLKLTTVLSWQIPRFEDSPNLYASVRLVWWRSREIGTAQFWPETHLKNCGCSTAKLAGQFFFSRLVETWKTQLRGFPNITQSSCKLLPHISLDMSWLRQASMDKWSPLPSIPPNWHKSTHHYHQQHHHQQHLREHRFMLEHPPFPSSIPHVWWKKRLPGTRPSGMSIPLLAKGTKVTKYIHL